MLDGIEDGKLVLEFKDEKSKEIEKKIAKIIKILEKIKVKCGDRMSEVFPYKEIESIVEECKEIEELARNVEISEEYLRSVMDSRDVVGYFTMQADELRKTEEIFRKKRGCFKVFGEKLREIQKSEFEQADNTKH